MNTVKLQNGSVIEFPKKLKKVVSSVVYVKRVSTEQLRKLNAHGFMVVLR